jgi:hypothetical protein
MSLVSFMGWRIHQMDVKTTFLNGIIEEEVYIEQPRGFEVSGKESHVCKLKKSLYGLKQAPRARYSRIDGYLQGMGFTKSEANSNLYYIFVQTGLLSLVLYVDDLFLIGVVKLIAGCKANTTVEFEMKDIDMMHYFLDLTETREIFLGQGMYVIQILKRFEMEDSKPMATPTITNLKKVTTSNSELVDPTLYR